MTYLCFVPCVLADTGDFFVLYLSVNSRVLYLYIHGNRWDLRELLEFREFLSYFRKRKLLRSLVLRGTLRQQRVKPERQAKE